MTPGTWPCPLESGEISEEYAIVFDQGRKRRLLIVPALFDEASKLRRLSVETMRRLDAVGIDSFLPDYPGTNESLLPLEARTPAHWHDAMAAAALHFSATHALGIRAGCLFAPPLPGWHYAPINGASVWRHLLRARVLASREAGREENREALADLARREGIELAGYRFGPAFAREFEGLTPPEGACTISQDQIGGPGLWLRAEPDEDNAQSDALATILAAGVRG